MPPKKSKLQKAHAALKKKRTEKPDKPEKPVKKKPVTAYPPTAKKIAQDADDEAEIQAFLAKLLQKPPGVFATMLSKFGEETKNYTQRQTITEILGLLPEEYYSDFTEQYLEQATEKSGMPFGRFWKEFRSRPEIASAIKEREELEKDQFLDKELEKEKRKRIKKQMEDLFGSDTDEESDDDMGGTDTPGSPEAKLLIGDNVYVAMSTGSEHLGKIIADVGDGMYRVRLEEALKPSGKSVVVVPARSLRRHRVTKYIVQGPGGEYIEAPGAPPSKPLYPPYEDRRCLEEYRSLTWVPGRVNQVYLAQAQADLSADWENPLGEISPYVIRGKEPRVEEGVEWYPASKAWKKLMCNRMKESRVQEGDVLTCLNDDGDAVRMMVAYDTTPGGFIVQGDSLFAAEVAALRAKRINRQEKIKRILDGPVTPAMETLALTKLSQALHKIAPNVLDYGDLHR